MSGCKLVAQDIDLRLDQRLVLSRLNLSVSSGWTSVIGPNGAGKSSLLRALVGVAPLSGGRVQLDGRDLQDWTGPARAKRMAWLSQQLESGAELTVRQTVLLGRLPQLGLWRQAAPEDHAAVDRAMGQVGVADWSERRLTALSGGERQRVHLARVLASEAECLLLDEPLAHLDPLHQLGLVKLFRTLAEQGSTVVSVMHELSLALLADRVAVMAGGQVLVCGEAGDPQVHEAITSVFGGAVQVQASGAHWMVLPRWGAL